jgi:hypothetical protein
MLAKDQIRLVAQELDRTADERIHAYEGQIERLHLWEVVRRASHAIQAVAEMERDDVTAEDRTRRARYLVSELETALEAARRARSALEWSSLRSPDA